MTRDALNRLHDQLYVLECAIQDVEADLAEPAGDDPAAVRRALDWLLENARPLVAVRVVAE